MTFAEAKIQLQALSGGAYRNIEYSVITNRHGDETPTCRVYAEGYDYCCGETWGEALDGLKRRMGLIDPNTDEAPQGDC